MKDTQDLENKAVKPEATKKKAASEKSIRDGRKEKEKGGSGGGFGSK